MLTPQTTKLLICTALLIGLTGCASNPEKSVDPLAGYNRAVHGFNDTLDSYVLKPVAKGYRVVTPDPVENGVNNFFGNLLEIRNIFNDVLQWKWKQAGNDTGRLLVNSTVGIAGIFDVAKYLNMEKSEGEDFGQTLAIWGVAQGPYIVLPFLGPSNLRDTVSLPLDWAVDPIGYIDHVPTRNSSRAFDFIVDRAAILDAEEFVSGDRYTFFREAYTQRRNYLINDGDVEDDFGSDDFDSEYDSEYEDDSF
ncbi:MAG: MlaA family lipoprotein [Cellvibrionaceae bacterium]